MTKLQEVFFNDFVRLKRGYDLPNDKIVDGKYPVVASTSIKAFHKEYKVLPPSVVTGRSGSLGDIQFIDTPCWPLNTALYVKNFNKNNPKYVYYFLKMMHLENFNSGAGVPTLNQNHLHKLKIKIHSKEEQQQIAEILSAYDDLIETNNQRITTLEQLAQQIYKEWFVRMRFPGWENTAFQHGIPDGWEELPFAGLVDILSGGTPSTNTISYWNGDVLFFTPKDANTNCIYAFDTEKKITDQGLENCNSSLYEPNTVFITARGTVGKVNLNLYSMAMNQSCFALRGKTGISQSYLFFATKSNVDSMKPIANGATFDAITIDSFSRFKALKPTSDLINKFDDILIPFLNEIKCIVEVNINLTRIRDLLLPRLISGKLSIKQAEAFTP